ncbi:MAG: hypothetical protein LUI87_12895 [Lachnospiraceae bacterium]|nr:hypothetical protein [Lachnospiraceae bacterium]
MDENKIAQGTLKRQLSDVQLHCKKLSDFAEREDHRVRRRNIQVGIFV